NTCVAFSGQMVSDDHKQPHLVPRVDERDWNWYAVRGGPEARSHKGPDLWPSPTGFGACSDLFASELLFSRPKVHQTRFVSTIADWRYGIDFGLPSAGAEPTFVESDYALSDFKWSELQSGTSFMNGLAAIQAHYLTAVLMSAYVRAMLGYGRGAAQQVKVH